MKPQTKMDLQKVMVISVIYLLISLFQAFYNNTIIRSEMSLGMSDLHEPEFNILWNLAVGALAALIGAPVYVFINTKLFRRHSFRFGIIWSFLTYAILFLAISIPISIFTGYDSGKVQFSSFGSILEVIKTDLGSHLTIVYFLVWGVISSATLFMLQVNDKFGPGVFRKFVLGKYVQPKEEDRVFMFIDMKSSTTIAEQIGNENYFSLLRDCFSILTVPIIDTKGEIYQYVGDEIVVSWPLDKGLKNGNCIRCFSEAKSAMEEAHDRLKSLYGVSPVFKAGIHHGKVTAGEIGDLKRDIVYSGDVLNTTSRIQMLCNQYHTGLLVSENVLNKLDPDLRSGAKRIKDVELKGKHDKVTVYSMSKDQ